MGIRTLAVSGAAVAVVALVAIRSLPGDPASPPATPVATTDAALPPTMGQVASDDDTTAASLPIPSHLRGVAVDGGVDVDRNGSLIVNRKLKNLFHHMIGMAEGDPARLSGVRESLKTWLLEQATPATAQDEVMAAFDRYMTYLEAASHVQLPSQSPGDLERVYQTLALLRRQHLGQVMAEGFFAEQEALDRYTVEQRRVLADDTLSPDERKQRLDALAQQLPESLARPLAQTRKISQLAQDTESLRASGASQEAIDRLRTERFGPEAAERFRALDQQQAQWKQRLVSYQAERDAIRADSSLAPEAQARAIDELVARRFSGTEVLRVRGLGNH
ncbi:Lipase chaperone [compost metagenome]|uniref:Lipase helper protein n=1 Tax=Cupriavidus campinensis TaxID=151783 RepID=A0AAE9I3E0_9BURK|nr:MULTISPECIES: lipase secretion chaperone [Cupriavidus]URF03156.1 hypothetical protein M5D45_11440 [Cupriavidus campinensis]CAG2154233.1 Lipase chaperone [Cupriavidus campinensis]